MRFDSFPSTGLSLLPVLFAVSACVSIEMELEELLPIQINHTDQSGLSLVILTESQLIERTYTDTLHRRVEKFPPRFILFMSASRSFDGAEIEIDSLTLEGADGLNHSLIPIGTNLLLRTREAEERGAYQDYTHLLFSGGDDLVRAIFFSDWVSGIEVGNEYVLTLEYTDLSGQEVSLTYEYEAAENSGGYPVPRNLPRT